MTTIEGTENSRVSSPIVHDPLLRLIQALARLPGVGEKSATRLAFHIIRDGKVRALQLADSIRDAVERVAFCSICMNLAHQEKCSICLDLRRDKKTICVVESVQDLRAIEATREYRGIYHVLHGLIQPLDGRGPEQIKIKELLERLSNKVELSAENCAELILATKPSVEGEATALYLSRMIAPLGIRITRIASGMPMGGEFEYADPGTIVKALLGRRDFS